MTDRPRLAARGLRKAYAAPVLVDVDLDLRAGEVHALLGANGAGKSTLTRLVCGLDRADAGTLAIDGAPYAPRTRREAERAGVQLVLQELNLIETLTVAENLALSHLPHRFGVIDRRRLRADAERALATMGIDGMSPDTPVAALGVGQRQLVEIARALAQQCRVLVLDEPTAALSGPEVDRLCARLEALRSTGLAVLYITHRLAEVHRLADRVTVLRDGRVVASVAAGGIDTSQLVEWMAGAEARPEEDGARHAISTVAAVHTSGRRVDGPPALCVEGLARGTALRGVTFDVAAGEVLGLSGLVGAGRTETLRAIVGADRPDAGRLLRDGVEVHPRHPADAARAGIGLVPEDRKGEGLLLTASVRENTTLGSVGARFARLGWIDEARERHEVRDVLQRLEVAYASIDQPVATLSGGNQQKVVLARWLLRECAVLLVDEPTRGIDVTARRTVHGLLRGLAAAGRAVVVASSDLDELMSVCDRIAVLAAGRVTGTFTRGEWSEGALVAAAFGRGRAEGAA